MILNQTNSEKIMNNELIIAKTADKSLGILANMSNRHGLITGATGTGKTVSLQVLAEHLSNIGVPVFLSDVKGDLSGLGAKAILSDKLKERLQKIGIDAPEPTKFPLTFWDVFGEQGHPLRTTVSDMGPLMLSRILGLNEVQAGVLQIIFKVADDNGLLILDIKDLRTMTQYVGENAKDISTQYGSVSTASIGAIQRGLLTIDEQGGDKFFGEPMLNIDDMMQTVDGRGVINVLIANKLISSPRLYGIFLLWLLSELFEKLPEVGDLEKPKFVFFFDEAHILFDEAPPILIEKIEQVVRLIRSKGVGVFFVTQNPLDIPDKVLGQLGNRIQHALRAYTPRDQKAVKTAAETMRINPNINTEQAITELGVGEALISFLDAKGAPTMVERAFVYPPASRIGEISQTERNEIINNSLVAGVYEEVIDRESAYEKLHGRVSGPAKKNSIAESSDGTFDSVLKGVGSIFGNRGGNSRRQSLGEAMAKTVVRSVGSQVANKLVRGILGSILK